MAILTVPPNIIITWGKAIEIREQAEYHSFHKPVKQNMLLVTFIRIKN